MKKFILFFEALILIMIPISYNFIPLNAGNKVFYLPSSKSSVIIETLQQNNYNLSWIDKIVISLNKQPTKGWYDINISKDGRFEFFYKLHEQRTKDTIDIVIFAGETKEELITRLCKDMSLNKIKSLKCYSTLAQFKEGDILAGKYTLAKKADENSTIAYIFAKSKERINKLAQKYPNIFAKKKKIKDIYTIASIIQKETYHKEEMPIIASVIYNRLDKNMKLQMDGTLNYGKYSHQIITPERIRNDKSHYNTYKYKGLPPHPISTVSIEALQSAITPAKSNYLYFMLNKNGKHNFVSTYKAHTKNVKIFKARKRVKKLNKPLKLNLGRIKINWAKIGI
ncbi:MAG: endolytic transglycosylase MltG [Sulfurovum sp.]